MSAEATARRAYKLSCKEGMDGKTLAAALKVRYASEAWNLSHVGRQIVEREKAALTAPEMLLLRCLAAEHRALTAAGAVRSPESKNVSWRARKGSGWAASTANKRLFVERYDLKASRSVRGLGFVNFSGNGYLSLTNAGWALVQAIEQAA